mmetsp:Transcript_30443/g.101158  ORF Transcript_30443/g.101158 Transcript_30443/m.101158 type:complete len:612 (-) Transcript_30443:1544-3379(-)
MLNSAKLLSSSASKSPARWLRPVAHSSAAHSSTTTTRRPAKRRLGYQAKASARRPPSKSKALYTPPPHPCCCAVQKRVITRAPEVVVVRTLAKNKIHIPNAGIKMSTDKTMMSMAAKLASSGLVWLLPCFRNQASSPNSAAKWPSPCRTPPGGGVDRVVVPTLPSSSDRWPMGNAGISWGGNVDVVLILVLLLVLVLLVLVLLLLLLVVVELTEAAIKAGTEITMGPRPSESPKGATAGTVIASSQPGRAIIMACSADERTGSTSCSSSSLPGCMSLPSAVAKAMPPSAMASSNGNPADRAAVSDARRISPSDLPSRRACSAATSAINLAANWAAFSESAPPARAAAAPAWAMSSKAGLPWSCFHICRTTAKAAACAAAAEAFEEGRPAASTSWRDKPVASTAAFAAMPTSVGVAPLAANLSATACAESCADRRAVSSPLAPAACAAADAANATSEGEASWFAIACATASAMNAAVGEPMAAAARSDETPIWIGDLCCASPVSTADVTALLVASKLVTGSGCNSGNCARAATAPAAACAAATASSIENPPRAACRTTAEAAAEPMTATILGDIKPAARIPLMAMFATSSGGQPAAAARSARSRARARVALC